MKAGFELLMPSNWRNLRAGDPLWLTVTGKRGSATENEVAGGTISDYAVPVLPRDVDSITNLAVYAGPSNGWTLEELGDIYSRQLGESKLSVVSRDNVNLPAGPAIRLFAIRPGNGSAGSVDHRTVVYVLVAGGRSYFLDFTSRASTSDSYGPEFLCMARSLKFTAGG